MVIIGLLNRGVVTSVQGSIPCPTATQKEIIMVNTEGPLEILLKQKHAEFKGTKLEKEIIKMIEDTELEKQKPIPNAICICGLDNRWIIWDNLLICDDCGEAYNMENDELIHPAIFNKTRKERLQK